MSFRKAFFSFSIVAILCMHAMAQEADTLATPAATATDRAYGSSGVSEQNRVGKKFLVTAQLFGIENDTEGSGLTLGYYIDSDSLITLEYISGSISSFYENIWGNDQTLRSKAFEIDYKKFVGNSFYVKGGLQHVQYDFTSSWSNDFFNLGDDTYRKLAGNATYITLAIGNQWQWQNFTLGCDWVGLNIPLSSQITSDSVTGSSVSQSDYDAQDDDRKNIFKSTELQLLRFYLGASF